MLHILLIRGICFLLCADLWAWAQLSKSSFNSLCPPCWRCTNWSDAQKACASTFKPPKLDSSRMRYKSELKIRLELYYPKLLICLVFITQFSELDKIFKIKGNLVYSYESLNLS